MAPVAQLTIAYGAGLWIGLVALVPFVALVALALMAAVSAWRWGWGGTLAVALVVGIVTGVLRADLGDRTCISRWSPGPKSVILSVRDAPGRRETTNADIRYAPDGCGGQLRLRVPHGEMEAGTTVLAVGQYFPGVLRVTRFRTLGQHRSVRFRLRDTVRRRIETLYGERAPLIEAMVLGRRDDIGPALRQEFADAGIAHLLAISGLHVGILAGWLLFLLGWSGVGKWRWPVAAALTWGYVLLLGFPTPASRAAAFLTIFAVARHRQRHPSSAAVLAVAVVVVLLLDPGAATAVGAWLSVAAVWGTRWGNQLLPTRLRRVDWARLLASSCGAVAATSPITAYAFGAVAPIGLVSNLVAIPLAAIAVPGVMASLLLGGILAGGAGLVLFAIERVATVAAAVPAGHITGVAGPGFALPWLALLGASVWVSRRAGSWVRLRRRLLWGVAAGAWSAVAMGLWPTFGDGRALVINVLDVGQGDAIAIRTPRGRWILVDAGPRTSTFDAGRNIVVPFLRRNGARAVTLVAVTHGDADHLGGVPAVLRSFESEMVVESGQPLASGLYGEFHAAIEAGGADWRAARAGDTIVVDSVVLAVLHPTSDWVARQFEPNENSVVIHLSYGCLDVLLTGDAGHVVERALLDIVGEVDVLKVGHHGSAGSTSAEWLEKLRPRAAVVSVGRNRYGQPAPEVLELLQDRGVPVWRTDRGGTVTVRSDGRYLSVGQGEQISLWGRLRCRIRRLLRSSGSFSSRSGCTPRPPVISPICSMRSR